MLRKEQNNLLCQTGPGTPMGQMFQLSWQPALLAEELPENECPPVRVKLLGERLLAWRRHSWSRVIRRSHLTWREVRRSACAATDDL